MKKQSNRLAYRAHYRRQLPHYQSPGAVIFVTYRLAGSLPINHLRRLRARAEAERLALEKEFNTQDDEMEQERQLDKQRRREFGRWDDALDSVLCGPTWLKLPQVAWVVVESLRHLDDERYELDAYCIMPNHVHALFQPLPKEDGSFYSLSSIMHSLKGFTGNKANKVLGRHGAFWQHESYDRMVRDEAEWERVVNYILNNPVKARLVESPEEWPWSYYRGRR